MGSAFLARTRGSNAGGGGGAPRLVAALLAQAEGHADRVTVRALVAAARVLLAPIAASRRKPGA